MRAILINPADKTITEVDYNGDFRTISKLIHADSGLFDIVCVGETDGVTHDLYVDDEGLFVPPELQHYFQWRHDLNDRDTWQVLAGSALLLDCDPDTGNSQASTLTIEHVAKHVQFKPN